MKLLSLQFVALIAILSASLLLCDAVVLARAALQRRKRRSGAIGVVVDRWGRVIGTYADPFGRPSRAARMHDTSSPWAVRGREGRKQCVWEGFGPTQEEALRAANRLRNLHLRLLPALGDGDGDGEDFLSTSARAAPPWD